jgi:hypothetical protein
MANPEHLDILKQGAEVWNLWREVNHSARINLTKANLTKADLRGSNLRGANLYRSNLNRANLSGADLTGAILSGANLSRASLSGTDFSNAVISYTIFSNLDLNVANGLESVRHRGPSSIGIDTLYMSKGKIPEVFLRGCGVPESMIEYVRSLTILPTECFSCFISCSHKDEAIAQRLLSDLQAKGVRCWYAFHELTAGDKTQSAINDLIRVHDKLLLILSESSVKSDWIEREVEHALDLEKKLKTNNLFPVRVDDSVIESNDSWADHVRRRRGIGDFSRWKDSDAYAAAFDSLLNEMIAE